MSNSHKYDMNQADPQLLANLLFIKIKEETL